MNTYTRVRRNRYIVKCSARFVILFSIVGGAVGVRSEIELTGRSLQGPMGGASVPS